ncbi:MAG: nitroreductase family deazaflavin-dependent oxidoreductase [Acidimicrobiia bacterium]|nr:nitroreductase family deazaflavin-dependent oxidoreductase [Acidimicrobiia bacterium]
MVCRSALNNLVRPFSKLGVGTPPPVGIGVVVVATTGRHSGRQREVPLAATRVDDTVIVSSVRRDSEWVKNLEFDPTATIWLDGRARGAEHRSAATRAQRRHVARHPSRRLSRTARPVVCAGVVWHNARRCVATSSPSYSSGSTPAPCRRVCSSTSRSGGRSLFRAGVAVRHREEQP